MDKVIVITGPTAVGKTKLSVEIAKKLNTDLINGDAYQIYKDMNIGTAKPTLEERSGITHHLMDYLETSDNYSIAQYQKDVRNCISNLINCNKIPIIVGGSGLYIDSVIKDYRFDEEKRNEKELSKYDNLSNEKLHDILKNLNLDVANTIHPNNRKRVLRAIELNNCSANSDSRSHRDEYIYDALVIFLYDDRESLYKRINSRVDTMIELGLVDEVKNIKEDNFSTTSKAAIGYKECLEYLNNKITYEEMIDLIKKNSRHYAKRQFTWFNNKTDSIKIKVNINDFNQTIDEVFKLIINFINKKISD